MQSLITLFITKLQRAGMLETILVMHAIYLKFSLLISSVQVWVVRGCSGEACLT